VSAAAAIDRILRKNADAAGSRKGYDLDAQAIVKVLVRHFGDEAGAVLQRTIQLLGEETRRTKR
jgi:hypothetical protein